MRWHGLHIPLESSVRAIHDLIEVSPLRIKANGVLLRLSPDQLHEGLTPMVLCTGRFAQENPRQHFRGVFRFCWVCIKCAHVFGQIGEGRLHLLPNGLTRATSHHGLHLSFQHMLSLHKALRNQVVSRGQHPQGDCLLRIPVRAQMP